MAYGVRHWARIFSIFFALSRAVLTQEGSRDCQSGASAHASALLQRAAQLQTATDSADGNTLKSGVQRLDHDGMAWQGAASRMTAGTKFKVANFLGNGAKANSPHEKPLTFITVRDSFFATNLARSSVWINRGMYPHQWLTIDNYENLAISFLYAEAQKAAQNDVMVFVHSDVFLPEGWYRNFMQKLYQIEEVDPDWAVLGTAGVPVSWTPHAALRLKIASRIEDCFNTYNTGIDSLEVQSFDEHLLVVRQNPSLKFDPELPGFDLYGTDIVLSARQHGSKAYLLNVPVLHKTVDEHGQPFNPAVFKVKFQDPSFQSRAQATIEYLRKKWCSSGLLPVYGTAFDITSCN